MQLFVSGPTWDSNLISKSGRSELIELGLAFYVNGWQSLTEEGVRVASEWDLAELRSSHDKRWYNKAACRWAKKRSSPPSTQRSPNQFPMVAQR